MNKKCPECGSDDLRDISGFPEVMLCMACGAEVLKKHLKNCTLFDRITSSMEVLAPKLVYETAIRTSNLMCDRYGNGVGIRYDIKEVWKSTITEDTYISETEAISATLAKLKEVGK